MKKNLPKDTDFAKVDKALKRAAKKARELAVKTRTPFYIFDDGQIINLTKHRKKALP